MTTRDRRADPPQLPGFTFVQTIGSGGFADVHLFEQHMPRRRVAVKVLHVDRMSREAVAEFATEANLMAMLSTHPSIATIYGAGESEDGRPFLVMEYAPKPTMQARVERAPLTIAEALRVGIQVAAAVETAHRAGVLHRDVKPANILVTEYGRPALTDFGIATTSTTESFGGMSIPWSAPELFADEPHGDQTADTYSLGATVYTLLSGHPPYQEEARRSNVSAIRAILTEPVPTLIRPDAPASLRAALLSAMAKDPADRPASSLAFARSLQKVEIELGLAVTPIDIIDDTPYREMVEGEIDGLTRVRAAGPGTTDVVPQPQRFLPAADPTSPGNAAALAAPKRTQTLDPPAPQPRTPAPQPALEAAVAVSERVVDVRMRRAARRARLIAVLTATVVLLALLAITIASSILLLGRSVSGVMSPPTGASVIEAAAPDDLFAMPIGYPQQVR